MKKIIILLIVIFLLIACAKQSDLTVYNDTEQSVRIVLGSTIHRLYPNDPPAVETCYLNSFILFGETKKVPVIIDGQIFLEHKDFHIEMKPGKDRSYHIELDRAGIQISNPSIYTITGVQLRREEDDWEYALGFPFGLYSEELSPTMSISANYDQIKIFYSIGNIQSEYIVDTIDLVIGETTTYIFTCN